MGERRFALSPGQKHTVAGMERRRNEINAAVTRSAIEHSVTLQKAVKHLAQIATEEGQVIRAVIAEAVVAGGDAPDAGNAYIDGHEVVLHVPDAPAPAAAVPTNDGGGGGNGKA